MEQEQNFGHNVALVGASSLKGKEVKEVVLGPVERDPACESGFWLWGAVDNLRLAARKAVEIIEDLMAAGDGSPISVKSSE